MQYAWGLRQHVFDRKVNKVVQDKNNIKKRQGGDPRDPPPAAIGINKGLLEIASQTFEICFLKF